MHSSNLLTTQIILNIFTEEVISHQGKVTDTFNDRKRLFVRSILPRVEEIRSRDRVQGGVALKATHEGISIHPYVFRQICTNGAIVAQAIQSRQLTNMDLYSVDEASFVIREAIQVCCEDDAFTTTMLQMRSATEVQIDQLMSIVSLLSRFQAAQSLEIFNQIIERFFLESDRTQYGLMNAITSVARDTNDAELKWKLEELGGKVPSMENLGSNISPNSIEDFESIAMVG